MLDNLSNNLIAQYFMDSTYKAVPPANPKYKLMVISAFNNHINKTVLCCFILLHKEDESTFKQIFIYLKNNYNFSPRNLMCDFALRLINAAREIFPDCSLHCCFFHYSQCLWKNFRKYRLCGKNTYNDNCALLFNLQLLCFNDRKRIKSFFGKIKQTFNNNKYNNFLNYFNRNWLGKKYPFCLWNYVDILSNNNNIEKFKFTKNINKFLNKHLKRGKCSANVLHNIILTVIIQFEMRKPNIDSNSKKTDLLKFYLEKNYDNIAVLKKEEIDKVFQQFVPSIAWKGKDFILYRFLIRILFLNLKFNF